MIFAAQTSIIICMTEKLMIVDCPTCGQPVEWGSQNRFRPFCSARCKLIDLGDWATEKYRVPTSENDPILGADPETGA